MPPERKFLIVDDNPDGRSLLTHTLARKFPGAEICATGGADIALALIAAGMPDAIVVHRAFEFSGCDVIRQIRAVAPGTPIVHVSGVDRTAEARAAGANAFLAYDAWLRLGTLIGELLDEPAPAGPTARPASVPSA